jgi:hypothetical protein
VLNVTALPLLLATLLALAWLALRRRAEARGPAAVPSILE